MKSADTPVDDTPEGPLEVTLIGDLTEHESDCYDKMLGVAAGSACTLYINSPGGSAYSAISLMTSQSRARFADGGSPLPDDPSLRAS